MRKLSFLLGCLLGAGALPSASAQQLLCQRTFTALGPSGYRNAGLTGNITAVNADSAVLLLGTFPNGPANGQPRRSALVWVKRGQCDTIPLQTVGTGVGGSYVSHSTAYALTTRRKYLRVATTRLNTNSTSILQLWEFTRRGQLRGQYSYPLTAALGTARGLLEAPDEGTYLSAEVDATLGATYRTALLKVDAAGQLQWQRTYSSGKKKDFGFNHPCYTVRGNLLLAGTVNGLNAAGAAEQYGQVVEVNQRGDSLTSRPLLRGRFNTQAHIQEAVSLRDGGFLILSQLDSATSATTALHFCGLTRLDANLNEVWTRFYRPAGKWVFPMQGEGRVLELTDGTLLGMVSLVNAVNGSYQEERMLRLSSTGQLTQEYVVPGAVLNAQSLAPLAADSSFALVGSTSAGSTIVQFKLPGLRRVVAAPAIPAAQPLATRATAGPAWPAPAYPNPASTSVTVPLLALTGEARLSLRDLLGRQVRTQDVAAGTSAATVAVGGLAPGVYVLTLEWAGQQAAVQRLTVAAGS